MPRDYIHLSSPVIVVVITPAISPIGPQTDEGPYYPDYQKYFHASPLSVSPYLVQHVVAIFPDFPQHSGNFR